MNRDGIPTQNETPHEIVARIMQQFDIDDAHPADCLAEAESWAQSPGLDDPTLIDWRSVPFVTIDNPDSRDLDQALFIEKHDDGYRLRYALADAAYYIKPGSALFDEALRRGASYYFPTTAAPMLPVQLSEGLVSLNPNSDRRSLVFDIQLQADGQVEKTTVVRALIKSCAKLNYKGVQNFLDSMDGGSTHGYTHTEFCSSLIALRELGEVLIERAQDRDVITYNRVETQISISNDNPPRFELGERKRYDTERYNEQLSLICNMVGANLFTTMLPQSDALQAIFRVHEAPLKAAHRSLRKTLQTLIKDRNLSEEWMWQENQSLADYVAKLPRSKNTHRLVMAIERQILMTNRASEFRAEPGRHYALRAPSYARFSSPMREIVGVFTHKELLDVMSDTTDSQTVDEQLQEEVIEAGNRSRIIQKMLNKEVEMNVIHGLLAQDVVQDEPPRYSGTVMGARGDRLYIAVDDFALDLKIYRQDLNEQFDTTYEFDSMAATNFDESPQWYIGDAVEIAARDFDAERRRYVLSIWPIEQS